MQLLVTALRPEAEPLIAHLGLKRDLSVKSHELFVGSDHLLIVSGVGSVRSAIATTLALTPLERTPLVVANIGIAGGPKNIPIGSPVRAVKLTDSITSEHFYPDVTIKLPFTPVELLTSPKPYEQNSPDYKMKFVVDMEATGFFRAAQSFVPLERIQIVKVVSDHFTKNGMNKTHIATCIEGNVEEILDSLATCAQVIQDASPNALLEEELRVINALESRFSLTHSQKRILQEKIISVRIRNGETKTTQALDIAENSPSELSAKRVFQQVLDVITS
ncbi:MAG: hypothetical protein KDD70_09205 [Bdellovibrionales bacterium]|nr:hypothetical protein [Bdellovibrionales bacterium]